MIIKDMSNISIIVILFILVNLVIFFTFKKNKIFRSIIDKPDKIRKLHILPVPLAGGMIIFTNLILFFLIYYFFYDFLPKEIFFQNFTIFIIFMISLVLVFFLGLVDDKVNINPLLKFLLLTIIIIPLLIFDESLVIKKIQLSFVSESIHFGHYGLIFSLFCFLVYLNAFNMFDGINLQSGLYSLLIFLSIFYFSYLSLLLLVLIISMVGFSFLNSKNLTFLGDSGTLMLAFLISYFFIKLYNFEIIFFADEIVLYMIIPGLDLIRLFVIRIMNKKNPFKPDRQHLHHLLLEKYQYKLTICIILFLILFPIILSYLSNNFFMILILTVLLYSLIVFNITKNFNSFQKDKL
jgi:UDP-GlcNAc:undecaprenyl-phosphate GlcNAc-1-phosphate transferase